ncbi:MAG: hypothetical protein IT495_17025 [Gammaproteobacteria bacterium]|nr:hypothetical protein [Gammaproteobacteria bacterium]
MQIHDQLQYRTQWTIRRYASHADYLAGAPSPVEDALTGELLPAESRVDGNLLLNEGIGELWDLACGLGSPTAWSNANARLGVGDSNTAAAASQTDLQATTNKTYKAMEASYPQRAAQTVTWRSVFGSTDANYAWEEMVVDNGAGAAKTLNRKVSAQGTKASGQTWTLDLSITLS